MSEPQSKPDSNELPSCTRTNPAPTIHLLSVDRLQADSSLNCVAQQARQVSCLALIPLREAVTFDSLCLKDLSAQDHSSGHAILTTLPPDSIAGLILLLSESTAPHERQQSVSVVAELQDMLNRNLHIDPVPLRLEKYPWPNDPQNRKWLMRFYLMGWAFRHHARSLRSVMKMLLRRSGELQGADIPRSLAVYSDCVKEIEELFGGCDFFGPDRLGEIAIFQRCGLKPVLTDRDHMDTRAIIGLTTVGENAWEEVRQFLRRHERQGPWHRAD